MRRLDHRVSALEQQAQAWKPWHRIIVKDGESDEDAIAAHEARNGPIGDGKRWLVILI
jgi:hypothetical protein